MGLMLILLWGLIGSFIFVLGLLIKSRKNIKDLIKIIREREETIKTFQEIIFKDGTKS